MKAIVIRSQGGPEVLQLQDVADPIVADGDLLIRNQFAGVNFIDVYHRTGVYAMDVPFIPGREGAGIVETVGIGVTDFKVGDRVAWPFSAASYAELVVVSAATAVKVPDDVALDVATAAMLQGMTAHYLVNSTFVVQSGQFVLVHAAAGGVGQLLCRLVSRIGATVIATVSSEAKAAIAREAGAEHIIRYDTEDVATRVREITNGDGVHVVYDGVGKDTFDASLASLRPRGMLALYGGASGQVPDFDLQRLNAGGSLFITRPTLGNYIATPAELRWRANELFALISAGELPIEIDTSYSLAEAALAHTALEARRTTGKLLLRVS